MNLSARAFESALTRKGFRLERRTRDKIFYFYHRGQRTQVHTKISEGRGESLRSKLIGEIKRQMFFDRTEQVGLFVDCSIDEDTYVHHLKQKNVIASD